MKDGTKNDGDRFARMINRASGIMMKAATDRKVDADASAQPRL